MGLAEQLVFGDVLFSLFAFSWTNLEGAAVLGLRFLESEIKSASQVDTPKLHNSGLIFRGLFRQIGTI